MNSVAAGIEGHGQVGRRRQSLKPLLVSLDWKGGVCSQAKIRRHTVLIDSSRDEGGSDLGPTPTEIFLASLGSCIMVNISRIGQKMKLDLKGVHMEITGIKEHNGRPSSFVALNVDVSIKADTQDLEKLERLVRLAEENCTVSNTLKNAVKPSVRLQPI
ncbi:MAG: OsmC family protein [Candidatus Bathyarchaeia archaeon]